MSTKERKASTNELEDIFDSSISSDTSNTQETISFDNIILTKVLSQAKFAVLLGCMPSEKKEFAVKIFPFKSNRPHISFINEISFANLQHENIISVLHYEEQREAAFTNISTTVSYIIMELAPYGDLYDIIMGRKIQVDEKLARTFFHQLINGVKYLHSVGIAHLDLKLDNLLLGQDYKLKICDFDQSYKQGHAIIMSRGSQSYRAPEIAQKNCQAPEAADIYSVGVILFILVSQGFIPYSEKEKFEGVDMFRTMMTDPNFFWKKTCEIQKRDQSFFSEDFKTLFMSMVAYDPAERFTIKEVEDSGWFGGDIYSRDELEKMLKANL